MSLHSRYAHAAVQAGIRTLLWRGEQSARGGALGGQAKRQVVMLLADGCWMLALETGQGANKGYVDRHHLTDKKSVDV